MHCSIYAATVRVSTPIQTLGRLLGHTTVIASEDKNLKCEAINLLFNDVLTRFYTHVKLNSLYETMRIGQAVRLEDLHRLLTYQALHRLCIADVCFEYRASQILSKLGSSASPEHRWSSIGELIPIDA